MYRNTPADDMFKRVQELIIIELVQLLIGQRKGSRSRSMIMFLCLQDAGAYGTNKV